MLAIIPGLMGGARGEVCAAPVRAGAVLLVSTVLSGCAVPWEGPAPATPERTTVSNDTNTTHRGTFELEAGASYDPTETLRTPVQLKYGISESAEVFVETEPVQWQELPGEDGVGFGDVLVGMRHRFLEQGAVRPSAGLQLVTKLPSADTDNGIGSGEIDFLPSVMVTRTLGAMSVTAFYELAILGEPGDTGTNLEHHLALSGGLTLDDRWGAFGEVFADFKVESDVDPVFAITGLTYAVADSMVLDGGVQIGLNDDAPDLVFRVGLTTNFGGPGAPQAP